MLIWRFSDENIVIAVPGNLLAFHRQSPVKQGEQDRQDSAAVGRRDGHVGQAGRKVEFGLDRQRPEVESHGPGQHFRRR